MELPNITIPLALPFDVPLMLHPVVVHFAVALPVVVLLIEVANLFFKRRALSVTSLLFLLLAAVIFIVAYFTGKADASEAFSLLNAEAQHELKDHRLLGTYLVYALVIPIVFKLLAMVLMQKWARGALIISLIVFISFLVKQGYDGGELVYEHGVNVVAVTQANDAMDDLQYTIEDFNETLADQADQIAELEAQVAVYEKEKQESLSTEVKQAYDHAVESVKTMFDDHNVTHPDANGSAPRHLDNEIRAIDANESEAI